MEASVKTFEIAVNNFANAILDVMDDQVGLFLAVIMLFLLTGASIAFRRRIPDKIEIIKAFISIASLLTCIPILCVFLLTRPPAIAKLSDDSRGVVGVISVAIIVYLGFSELKSVLFARSKVSVNRSPPPPAPPD